MRIAFTPSTLLVSAAFVLTALASVSNPVRAVAAAPPPQPGSANPTGANATGSPAPQPTSASAPLPTACPSSSPPPIADNSQVSVNVDPKTTWQPTDGTVLFRVATKTADLNGSSVRVCFGWDDIYKVSTPSIDSFDANGVTYRVRVPNLGPPTSGTPRELWVPLANMRVIVYGANGSQSIDVVQHIGITKSWVGLLVAAIVAALALAFCSFVARQRGVPGTSVFLQIVSTQSGYASLSQFQLILWTLVIGVGAVYVMVLSGNLLDITTGALVLLGISGGAILAAKIQSNQSETPPQGSTGLQTPGKVQTVYCDATTDSEASLRWVAPIDGGAVSNYVVEYAVVPATGDPQWSRVWEAIDLPRHTVLGLLPATQYTFRVTASNAAGQSDASPAIVERTTSAPVPPAGSPAQIAGLAVGRTTISSVSLAWPTDPAATAYLLEKRVHDSGSQWQAVPITSPLEATAVVSNLDSGTRYDFRVTARNANGTGLPSSVITVRTPRKPLWSDLVVTGFDEVTIDVTRLQALFFTMIAAAFVSIKILIGYTIPDIPDGFLILMGISNGVYIGAKFVPNTN